MACARGGKTICLIIGERGPSVGRVGSGYLVDVVRFRIFRSLVTGVGGAVEVWGNLGVCAGCGERKEGLTRRRTKGNQGEGRRTKKADRRILTRRGTMSDQREGGGTKERTGGSPTKPDQGDPEDANGGQGWVWVLVDCSGGRGGNGLRGAGFGFSDGREVVSVVGVAGIFGELRVAVMARGGGADFGLDVTGSSGLDPWRETRAD
jgi:hypothetical protein